MISFLQVLQETIDSNDTSIRHGIDDWTSKLKVHKLSVGKGLAKAELQEYPKTINLGHIHTNPKYLGQGHASKLMNHIKTYADSRKKPVELDATALNKNTNQDQLVGFYKKHGFQLKGTTSFSMRREPK